MERREQILSDLLGEREQMAEDMAAIDRAIAELRKVHGADHVANGFDGPPLPKPKKVVRLSAAGRRAISKASKLRWAKHRRAKKARR